MTSQSKDHQNQRPVEPVTFGDPDSRPEATHGDPLTGTSVWPAQASEDPEQEAWLTATAAKATTV